MEVINSLHFEAMERTRVTINLKKEARLHATNMLWFEQTTKPQLLM